MKPVGGQELLLKGPRSLTLGGGKDKHYNDWVRVPENLSLGDYILSLEAMSLTEELLDEDSFRVRVVGSGGVKGGSSMKYYPD